MNEQPVSKIPFKGDWGWLLAQLHGSFTPAHADGCGAQRTFTASGTQSAEFTQALGQITEWKAILSEPENVLQFYKCFDIPDWIRKKTFAPQYGLIYGRRSEFESDPLLLKKRAQLVPADVMLISFDRLHPDPKGDDLLCSTLCHGKYTSIDLLKLVNFIPIIPNIMGLL